MAEEGMHISLSRANMHGFYSSLVFLAIFVLIQYLDIEYQIRSYSNEVH